MQIKTTIRCHFTRYYSTRMAIFKKWKITNVVKVVEKLEPSYIVGRNVKWHHYDMTQPIWPGNFTTIYVPKSIENICSCENLYLNVHSSIIHNSQKVERTQMSSNWWTHKQNVTYILYIWILFSHKKEWISDSRYNVDECWKHYAKTKKPVIRGHVLYDSFYIKCPE